MQNIPIGQVLTQNGYVTEEQVNEALAYQKSHPELRLGAVFLKLGYVTELQLLEALSKRMELELVDLKQYLVDPAAVEKLPRQIAERYCLIAISAAGGSLKIAMSDPLNLYAIEDVRQIAQMSVVVALAPTDAIHEAIEYYYAEIDAKAAARMANDIIPAEAAAIETVEEDTGGEAPVVQVLNSLLVRAYSINASDIHIEPFETHVSVRMRVDGVITDYVTLSTSVHQSLVARVKIISNLDIAERRLPQDGHFKINLGGTEMNARVSIIPTVYGEKTVIRFLSMQAKIDNAQYYGMTEDNYSKFKRMLDSPHGIIYITGPTGSGKTTTLYMVLEQMARRPVNISTIEDPVERNLARVNQVQVNNVAGLTFEAGLRSLLRQDPDIIMVGETRDAETAQISVRAAITGHLVFSTLHTNDAISSVVRLRDMGVPAYLVGSSLVGLVAQRLMRKVCPDCAYEYTPDESEAALLGPEVKRLVRGRGCHLCNNTGYRGRIAVHEVVYFDKAIRRMVVNEESTEAIENYVREHQSFKTLRDSALELVKNGVSTLEEFQKIAYYSN